MGGYLGERESGYWGREHNEPISYKIHWIDQEFASWVRSVYGSEKKLLDQVAQVVSLSQTEYAGYHHPTGGRVQVYPLSEPFIDPKFKLPCFEIDAKGIGLTTAGHRQYSKHFSCDEPRREVLRSPDKYHELWGPEGLQTAQAEVYDIGVVRSLDIMTPYPAAILLPEEFVLDGYKVPVEEITRRRFNVTSDDQLAILIRAYLLSSTRSSDLIGDLDLSDGAIGQIIGNDKSKRNNLITTIRHSRELWKRFERPRIMKGLERKIGNYNFDIDYFQYVYQITLSHLVTMLRLGLSPTTGKESKDQSCCHTTLHNWTTGGAIVEWSPITRMKNLNEKNKYNHINQLVNHAHQYIIATGQVCLSQFDIIPSFFQFLNDLKQRINTHEIEEMYNEYRPRSNEEAEIETEKAIKAGKHVVLLNRRGNNDSYLEWLQENQSQFN